MLAKHSSNTVVIHDRAFYFAQVGENVSSKYEAGEIDKVQVGNLFAPKWVATFQAGENEPANPH